MKRTFLCFALSISIMTLGMVPNAFASEPKGAIKLGLDLATATADKQSLTEGMKKVGQDQLDEWMWDSIGGYEMLIRSRSEASIPAAKDKLKKIVELVDNIEKFAIAVTEGKYDDALFTAIDQAVSIANHPLVSVTWAACKLTYESHKMVQATKAAVDIERIYYMISNDRRLMGVGGSKDSPPQLPMTSESVDYFFEKYVITDASAREAFRSYVEKEIGESWPEASWGEWARSWMAVGSGVDAEQAAEIARLSGEWRNKARTWIMKLMKDVNEQARVYWAQVRVRQEMARFQEFQKRVGHFYNNDFEQMAREFQSMRRHEESLPQYREALAQSQKQRPQVQQKIESRDYLKERNGVSNVTSALDTWSRDTYSASTGAQIGGDKQLSSALMDETRAWRAMRDNFSKETKENTDEILDEQVKEATAAHTYATHSVWVAKQSKIESTARQYYATFFEKLITPFDFVEYYLDVEDSEGGSHRVSADPDEVKKALLDFLNGGRFDLAQGLIAAWDSTLSPEFRDYRFNMQAQAKKLLEQSPDDLTSARQAFDERYAAVSAQVVPMHEQIRPIAERGERVRRACSGFYGTPPSCWDEYFQAMAPARVIGERISALWATVVPFREAWDIENHGWQRAARAANINLKNLLDLDAVVFRQARIDLSEIYNAFNSLRIARKEQYDSYIAVINRLKGFFENDLIQLQKLADNAEERFKKLSEDAYTYVTPIRSDPALFINLPGALRGLAERIGRHHGSLQSIENEARRREQKFEEFLSGWENLPVLDRDEVDQIRVLVDPEFDYFAIAEEIKRKTPEIKRSLQTVRSNVDKFEQFADTDESNRMKDALWLRKEADKIQIFLSDMQSQGYLGWRRSAYGINVNIDQNAGMVLLEEPYKRYAIDKDLEGFVTPVRSAWQRSGLSGFVSQYAPDHYRSWQDILSLPGVAPARDENFIMWTGEVVYAEDIAKARSLISSLKPGSEQFDDVMRDVARLLPRVLNVRTDAEQKTLEGTARNLYGMSVEDYMKQMRVKPDSFTMRENALNLGPGENYEIGKAFLDAVKALGTLTREHSAYLAEAAARKRQAEQEARDKERREQEAQRQRQAALASMPRGLADYYGYYVIDPRINSYSLANVRGDVILTHDEVQQGSFNLSGRMSNLERARKMFISVDGGRSWNELALADTFSYTFNPMPDMPYHFIMRVQTVDEDDITFDMLPNAQSVTYKNISFKQLVLDTVKAIAEAYERADIAEFSNYISREYLGQRVFLEEGVRFDFDMFTDIRLVIYVNRIEQRSDMYVVETNWQKTQTPRKTGQQQRTTGRTTFMFVLEDGMMKVKNLRGDLLYATLSPEIAQASGLSSTVVDQIRTARDEQNPVQPGARETQEDGGLTSSDSSEGILTVYQATLRISRGYDFAAHSVINDWDGDIYHDVGDTFEVLPGAGMQETAEAFHDIIEIDAMPGTGFLDYSVGKKFIFRTTGGYYGKLEVLSVSGDPGEGWGDPEWSPREVTFRYAVQTDGTTNVRTQ